MTETKKGKVYMIGMSNEVKDKILIEEVLTNREGLYTKPLFAVSEKLEKRLYSLLRKLERERVNKENQDTETVH